MTLKFQGPVLPFFQVKEGISRTSLRWALQEQEMPFNFFSYKETGKITTDELRTRTKFQWFFNEMPRSLFKCLIVSIPGLLQGLHTMSLAKAVPEGLNPQECEQTKLREPPPVPYIPKKDKVQDKVAKLCNLQIKTLLEKDTTLHFPVWHKNGTREVFLMHVTVVLNAMKKRGHFNNYDRAQKAYEEAKKVAELAEAGLALLEGTSTGTTSKRKKKVLAKAKEAAKESLVKAHETKPEIKGAVEATNVTEDLMKDGFQEGQASPGDCGGRNDHCRKLDVHVLLKLAFSQEQVCMEQDHC
jgi:hypothetical protein